MNTINQSLFIPRAPLTEKNLEDQSGRVFIVTGGYTGVGYELSSILFQRNGVVYIAGRSEEKAKNAITTIQQLHPGSTGRVEFLLLDLADLSGIRQAAKTFMARESRLDVLTNNAGVMIPPKGSKTTQGFELQLGTNCLGPYHFTQCLLPVLRQTAAVSPPGSVRITWAASVTIELYAPRNGVVFDPNGSPREHRSQESNYGQSKAGNYFLAVETARRYHDAGIVSVAWNPGNLKTELLRDFKPVKRAVWEMLMYPAINGAYTELYAGWSSDISLSNSGCYIKPWGRIGHVRKDVEIAAKRADQGGTGGAEKFWEWCESITRQY
ncbi:uncharacterized protein ACLA_063790 [Aspergillus clavatus NRRL 1]|uniref:Short-chain dehydrogenase n=1 Tax=Aspergillus clavatus (strain ATCC 1007 / CBS 513.65 / DSM 816 / NCTC 3887 / NRRL 1 / QM 1276 / 107) TaxID=344612 RepID=A1CD02_ASPCL|nr:uncharacterized protein ACLA_063790 [Aspergillus clavatus NRRL 1]EAW12409.1 conserved hypothetical protein [Aspergillus clavatus NRRL 1]